MRAIWHPSFPWPAGGIVIAHSLWQPSALTPQSKMSRTRMPSFSTSKSGDIEDTPSETGTAMSELSRASSTTRRSIFHKRNPLHKVQKMLGRKSSSSLSMSAVAKISESPTPSEGPTEEATPPSTEPTSRMDPEEEVTPLMGASAEETPVVVKKEMNALEKIGSFLSGGEKKEEEATTEAAPPPDRRAERDQGRHHADPDHPEDHVYARAAGGRADHADDDRGAGGRARAAAAQVAGRDLLARVAEGPSDGGRCREPDRSAGRPEVEGRGGGGEDGADLVEAGDGVLLPAVAAVEKLE